MECPFPERGAEFSNYSLFTFKGYNEYMTYLLPVKNAYNLAKVFLKTQSSCNTYQNLTKMCI